MDELARLYREDFDRISAFGPKLWNHNLVYHDFLIKQLPSPCHRALDLGCGTGSFSRRLAGCADRVVGLDFSSKMIEVARRHSQAFENIDYRVGEILKEEFPPEHFDAIVTLTTLHHLPMAETLTRLVAMIRPGGVLMVLDIPLEHSLIDYARAAIAAPVNRLLRVLHNRSLRTDPAETAAWLEHGARDVYLPLKEVRSICRQVLPGARVRRHLLWRYSIVWRKNQPLPPHG